MLMVDFSRWFGQMRIRYYKNNKKSDLFNYKYNYIIDYMAISLYSLEILYKIEYVNFVLFK